MYITYNNLRWKSELLEQNNNQQNFVFQLKQDSCHRNRKCLDSGRQETFHHEPQLLNLLYYKYLLVDSLWRELLFENVSKISGQCELRRMGNTVEVTFLFGAEMHKIWIKFKCDTHKMHLKARVFALLLEELEVI